MLRTPRFWAAELQLDHLLSFCSEADRDAELRNIPTSLPRLYSLISGRLPEAYDRKFVGATLQWLQELELGPDELSLGQLCEGLSIFLSKDNGPVTQTRGVIESRLLRLYGTLVRRTMDGSTIELAHHGVREMLPARSQNVRYEIGIACLRLLNFREFRRDPAEYRLEQHYAEQRNLRHPLYSYAVNAWLEVDSADGSNADVEKEFLDQACRLFCSQHRGNMVSWLVELGRQKFETLYHLSPAQTFICLTTTYKRYTISPLHIAACFGISYLCNALIGKGVNASLESTMGSPLYCALAGPALLLSDALPYGWSVGQKKFRLDSRLSTAQMLMALGAQYESSSIGPSFAAVALMACAARSDPGDVELFTSLCPDTQYLDDEDFLSTFEDGKFPWSQGANRAFISQQMRFLEHMCILLIDAAWAKPSFKVRRAAWDKAVRFKLKCVDPGTRRQLPVDDDTFAKCMAGAAQLGSEMDIRRLMQDSRWNANLPLAAEADEDQGRTLLHRAVERNHYTLVSLLLKYGRADVSVRDASGRTPLHLCERSDVLRLLVEHGAHLRQVDNDGRLLWHYAAANNDHELLRPLLELDNDRDWVLRQTTKQGRTPLAEAFAFVRELVGEPAVPRVRFPRYLVRNTQSVDFLLDLITTNDPAYFRSDVPLICFAAEWGLPGVLAKLRSKGASLDLLTPDGSGPFHFLNFWACATPRVACIIKQICGDAELPVLDQAGHSPAETVFLVFKPDNEEPPENAHPSNYGELDRAAYMELLTDDVCKSRDHRDRPLWVRFCHDVIRHFAQKDDWPRIGNAISMAVDCFIEKGVIQEYDSAFGRCAFLELLQRLRGTAMDDVATWLPTVLLQVIRATTKVDAMKDFPPLISTLRSTVADGAIGVVYRDVLAELEYMGVPIDRPADGLPMSSTDP